MAVACAALVVASVPMLAIAGAILLTIGRPILFRQIRPGLYGRPFTIVKFRTMQGRPEDGPDVDRLTRFGRFLRRNSLDELPELWNVLRGDMSLVGPRPLLPEYLPLYNAQQARRHDVRPGITGYAQVCGRNLATWGERLALDVWYVNHRSLWLDVRILWQTFRVVVRREGISHPDHTTMPRFRGEADSAGTKS